MICRQCNPGVAAPAGGRKAWCDIV